MQNIPQQMKAMAVDEFGGIDKLTLHTLPVPTVDVGEVLIRVEVAGVGIWDAMEREGDVSPNPRKFRQPKFIPATISSRLMTCQAL
jgi:NADPH:quinone reductase